KSVFHAIDLQRTGERSAACAIKQNDRVPNKDFELRYRVVGEKPEVAVLAHAPSGGDGYFMLMVQPADDEMLRKAPPREIVFLVDVSGSMGGDPTARVKDCMDRFLGQVRPQDRIQLTTFAGTPYDVFEEPKPATRANIAKLKAYTQNYSSGGGTMMLPAIKKALSDNLENDRVRIVIMLTDGYIGNEARIIKEVGEKCGDQIRFWCLGIGNNVNRFLTDGVAKQGGGMSKLVPLNAKAEDITATVTEVMERITRAQLADIRINWGGLEIYDTYPARVPELWAGRPVVVWGRYSGGGRARIRVDGSAEGKPVSFPVDVNLPEKESSHDVLSKVWARRKIADLMDQVYMQNSPDVVEEVTLLALEHKLMTRYTSFVAVDEESGPDPAQKPKPPRRVRVNLPIPGRGEWTPQFFGQAETSIRSAVVDGRVVIYREPEYRKDVDALLREQVPPKLTDELVAQARKAFREGRELYDDLRYEEALARFEEALRVNPGHGSARQYSAKTRAILNVGLDPMRKALASLERAERVRVEEALAKVQKIIDDGRRAEAGIFTLRDVKSEKKPDELLADRRKKGEAALRNYEKALELMRWLPEGVDLTALEKRVNTSRRQTEGALQEVDGQLAALKKAEAEKARMATSEREQLFFYKKIRAMLDRARFDYSKGRYYEAAAICDQVLRLASDSREAAALRAASGSGLERMAARRSYMDYRIESRGTMQHVEDATVPHSRVLVYPDNWKKVMLRTETLAIDEKSEAIKDWVDLSKRAKIPHSRLLVYPHNWDGVRARESAEKARQEWRAARTGGMPGLALEDSQFTDWDGYGLADADGDGKPDTGHRVPLLKNIPVMGRLYGDSYHGPYSGERAPGDKESTLSVPSGVGRDAVLRSTEAQSEGYSSRVDHGIIYGTYRHCMAERDLEAEKIAAESRAARADISAKSQTLLAKQVEVMRQELERSRQIIVKLKERETVLRGDTGTGPGVPSTESQELARARRELAELHRDRKRIAEELANAEQLIASLVKKGFDVCRHVGPGALGAVPDVRSKVVDVRPSTGHVAIGAGKDSGIKEGFIFLVHRGDEYIAKIRVTTVWKDFCGGTILERKKPIKAGDDAMTDTAPTPEGPGVSKPGTKPDAEAQWMVEVRRKLEKKVSFRHVDEPLGKVLEKISAQVDVKITIDPKAAGAAKKKVTLAMTDVSAFLAVTWLARLSGLECDLRDGGVFLLGSEGKGPAAPPAPRRRHLLLKSATPGQRGRIVLAAVGEMLRREAGAEAKADAARVSALLEAAEVFEGYDRLDDARGHLQLAWLFDTARARCGASGGAGAREALRRLAAL
ncbi:MAG: VWA domain-containing protein, partial [Planctomycetota bacterium]